MANDSLLEQEKFWRILKYLLADTKAKDISRVKEELNISQLELNSYLNFLNEIGAEVNTEINQQGIKILSIAEEAKSIELKFSLFEWLAFQAHFPTLSSCSKSPYHEDVKRLLTEAEFQNQNHDLFPPLATLESILFAKQKPSLLDQVQFHAQERTNSKEIVSFIEESILDKKLIQLQTSGSAGIDIFPRKIVFFDGQLNLIGEAVIDKCLLRVPLSKILAVIELDDEIKAEYSLIEVDDFVTSLRAMSDNQVRLVLKINSTERFNEHFNTIFLERPCLFTNPQGDYIWAATLEPSVEIFEWLCELGPNVEILDPNTFKLDFIKYCEDKLKKIA